MFLIWLNLKHGLTTLLSISRDKSEITKRKNKRKLIQSKYTESDCRLGTIYFWRFKKISSSLIIHQISIQRFTFFFQLTEPFPDYLHYKSWTKVLIFSFYTHISAAVRSKLFGGFIFHDW